MNRLKLLTISVIGLLVINLGTLSFLFFSSKSNHGKGPRPNQMAGEGPKRLIIERLKLNDQQQADFELMVDEHKDGMRVLTKKSRQLHDALFTLLNEENLNIGAKDSLLAEISLNQKNIETLTFNHFQKIKSICTPDQLDNYSELIEEIGHLFKQEGPSNHPPRD